MTEIYPKMDKPMAKFQVVITLSVMEAVLEAGFDEMCRSLANDNPDLSMFPLVKKRFEELGLCPKGDMKNGESALPVV